MVHWCGTQVIQLDGRPAIGATTSHAPSGLTRFFVVYYSGIDGALVRNAGYQLDGRPAIGATVRKRGVGLR
ncbi:hypothetical protein CEXT_425721 [Caerostris extrusa]|uniref:Uncharacterized protein n=1 Tax=Caerostris extrusa TaxID=172846 RepID=A0AAV4XTY7_CAEEX|nr:hypothetical protein CEXT_425721 [Caerostris extrusa]